MRKNDHSTGGKWAKGLNDFLCFIKVKFEKEWVLLSKPPKMLKQ